MEKIEYGPNWEDNLGGTFEERKKDPNLNGTISMFKAPGFSRLRPAVAVERMAATIRPVIRFFFKRQSLSFRPYLRRLAGTGASDGGFDGNVP